MRMNIYDISWSVLKLATFCLQNKNQITFRHRTKYYERKIPVYHIETYFGLLHPTGLFDRDRSWSRNWPKVIWQLDTLALLWRSCCNTVKTASETSCGVGIFLWLAIVGQPIVVPRLWRSAYFAATHLNKDAKMLSSDENS